MRIFILVISVAVATLSLAGCGDSSPADTSPVGGVDAPPATNGSTGETTSTAAPTTASTAAQSTTSTATATSTTTTTTAPPLPMGASWVRAEPPIDVMAIAGTDDQLWVVGRTDGVHRLFRTDDLEEWTEVDLLALGLRLDGDAQAGTLPGKVIAASNETEAIFGLAQFPVEGLSETSASGDVWMVRASGETVDLLSPEQSGVDQRLAGPKNFRFAYFADSARFGEQLTLVAGGRWWEPFSTTDVDLSTITLSADGTFATASLDESETFRPSQIGASDEMMIVFGTPWSPLDRLHTRVTTDGSTWSDGGPIAPDGASEVRSLDAAGIGSTIVVATRVIHPDDGTSIVFWTTEDGLSWESFELPTLLESPDAASIHRVDDELILIVGSFPDSALWRSANGRDWEPIETAGRTPSQAGQTTIWNGRLVVHDGFAVLVSPPLDDEG